MWRKYSAVLSVFIGFALYAEPIQIVTEHLSPFQVVHDDGSISGQNTALVRRIFEHAKLDYRIDSNEWTISYKQALTERNVCIYSIAKMPERSGKFQWVGHLNSIRSHFYSLTSKNIKIESLIDTYKYTVAALEDDFSYYYLASLGFELHKNMYPISSRENIISVLIRRPETVDFVMLSDDLFAEQATEKQHQLITKHEEFLVADTAFWLACSLKTSEKFVNKLRHSLKYIQQNVD